MNTNEQDMREIAVAFCHLVRRRECQLWVIARCPLCGKEHTHGAGPMDGDPRRFLGHRISHCATFPRGEYELFEGVNMDDLKKEGMVGNDEKTKIAKD
jgi:hypothetical protein